MVYPIPNYTRIKVRGHFVDLAKAASEEESYGLTGPVQFIPTATVAVNQGLTQIIGMAPFVVFPDPTDGYFEVLLPATDDPDINPVDWNYKVVEPTGRSYYLVVPYDVPAVTDPEDPDVGLQVIDLSDVVPNPDADPGTVQTLVGEAGRGIATIDIDGSNHLVGTYTDATAWDAGLVSGVQSVNGEAGVVVLDKVDIGLGNVDNTSDAAKPVSTATQTALDGKAATSHDHVAADLPIVPWVIQAVSHSGAGALATDADSGSGPLLRKVTMTANITSLDVPTDAADGQVIKYHLFASGGTRTVTFSSSIRTSTGLTRGAHSISSGQMMIAALEYSALISAWVLTAYTISAT